MQHVLDDIAARSGLAPDTAATATVLVAAFASTTLTPFRLADLRRRFAEIDDLAAAGRQKAEDMAAGRADRPSRGLGAAIAGTLGNAMAGATSGPAAETFALVGRLGDLGMSIGDMKALTSALVGHLRARAGDAYVDDMLARAKRKVPILGPYLG